MVERLREVVILLHYIGTTHLATLFLANTHYKPRPTKQIRNNSNIKMMNLMHSLPSLCAQSYALTPKSFLRRCWSTNSHGFSGVDWSQWKLQTNSGAAMSDKTTNNLDVLILTHPICVHDVACVHCSRGARKYHKMGNCACMNLCFHRKA